VQYVVRRAEKEEEEEERRSFQDLETFDE